MIVEQLSSSRCYCTFERQGPRICAYALTMVMVLSVTKHMVSTTTSQPAAAEEEEDAATASGEAPTSPRPIAYSTPPSEAFSIVPTLMASDHFTLQGGPCVRGIGFDDIEFKVPGEYMIHNFK